LGGIGQAVLGSLSSSIIGRGDMSNLMKQETAHLLLDVSYLSQLEQKVVVDAPLDTEGLEVEMEMNNLLLSLRPIRQEQLISPNHKMVLLAALSDSLDYMSESVQQYVPEPKISCWKNAYVMSRGKFSLLASFIAWSALTGNENVRACTGGMLRQAGQFPGNVGQRIEHVFESGF
jgi:hypothetical protein